MRGSQLECTVFYFVCFSIHTCSLLVCLQAPFQLRAGASHIFFTLFDARTSCLRKSAADAYNKAKDTIKYLINAMLVARR